MDLKRWRTRTWTITDEDGETATVRHRPLSHAWRLRLLEAGAAQSSGDRPADLASIRGVLEEQHSLFVDLLDDLVVEVIGLTVGGEPLSREDANRALAGVPELMHEFLVYLHGAAEVSSEQGKV